VRVKFRSLHARYVAAAAIWTFGLLVLTATVGYLWVEHSPRSARIVHISMMSLAGAALVTAGLAVIRRGLSPFLLLRERLAAVREGSAPRLDGEYPSEVEPLVEDLNALLEEREQRVARAVAKAGDLAHGLKTPLAVLARDIDLADAAGHHELALSIRHQVEKMRRQVESHLAQARAAARGGAPGARASVVDAAHGLIRTMERLHAGRALALAVNVPGDVLVRVPLEDFEEMLGNLLDNACKWATSRVTISARVEGGRATVDVDDDGRGLPAEMREQVLQRGVRADETAPGSGLGLAIVRDLADAYGGSIALEGSPDGGLRARLTLPAQSPLD
jgi:signal transduction histidine kinase